MSYTSYMQTLKGEHVTWRDLENPNEDELLEVAQQYNIHPLVADELGRSTFRPKVENYDHFLYLILHFPVYDARDASRGKEVDFIVGKDFLVTTHYEHIPTLAALMKEDTHMKEKTAGHLLFYILIALFKATIKELETVDKEITAMENRLFLKRHKATVEDISRLRREILDFRRAVQPQESVLTSLKEQGKDFFGKDIVPYFNILVGEHLRIWHLLENHKETIEALQETNESLISMRTSEITKNLTIMAFITFPLTLFASLFGMNTVMSPIVGRPYDFWIIVGIMIAAIISMFLFVRYKKWI